VGADRRCAATVKVTQFQKTLGLAMAFAQVMPFRYAWFEAKIFGLNATNKREAGLKKGFGIYGECESGDTRKSKVSAN